MRARPVSTLIHTSTRNFSITKLRETIQAQAAVIEKLREALIHCVKVFKSLSERGQYPKELLPSEREFLGHQSFMFMTDALATPTDITQILDEVRRAERERCAALCEKSDRYRGDYFAAKIRAMGDE